MTRFNFRLLVLKTETLFPFPLTSIELRIITDRYIISS